MKFLTFFMPLLVITAGCAQPKYETPATRSGIGQELDSPSDCSLRFSKSNLCLFWSWEKLPTDTESGTLILKVYRLNALDQSMFPVDPPHELDFVLWMPSMGHGSSPASLAKVDIGSYRITDVYFVMRGEWELIFRLKNGEQTEDEILVPFTF